MSKEQFLQANFHFLLHNPAWTNGNPSPASPGLQEAFFDPDVLVDWETVNTVRLFRKVHETRGASSPSSGGADDPPPSASTPAETALPEEAADAGAKASAADTAGKVSSDCPRSGEPNTAAPPGEGMQPENGAWRNQSSSSGVKGLTVLPARKEISWGSGKKNHGAAAAAAAAAAPAAGARVVVDLKLPVQDVTSATSTVRGGDSATVASGGTASNVDYVGAQEEEEEEEGWRCPICLGAPVVPRVTKCGHGPFCLVCILRHLNGEGSARCPLCFDKMHRHQLRRVACQDVHPHAPGGQASLLLLQRERSSLVPMQRRAPPCGGNAGGGGKGEEGTRASVPSGGTKRYIPGGSVEHRGGSGEEDWAAGVCPKEGDDSERFSRLVIAQASNLRDLAAAEQFALMTFRHKSIASGETEWVPYVSQAQALVNTQLERLSSVVSSRSSSSSSSSKAAKSDQRPVAAAGGGFRGRHEEVKKTAGGGTPSRRSGAGKAKGSRLPDGGAGDTSGGGGNGVCPPGRGNSSGSNGDGIGEDEVSPSPQVGTSGDEDVDARLTASGEEGGARDPKVKGNASVNITSNDSSSGHRNVDGGDTSPAPAGAPGGGPFKFFQSGDGQKVFLHPFDMRQLLDDADKGLPLPDRIDAQVLEVETVKLTPELRRRLPFLGHLPIHCDISFLEVDMAAFVSEDTANKFREETQKRERKRRGRAAQEARVAKKEARLEQDRADRIAAMRAFTVDLQGPTPGGAETPPPSSAPPLPSSTRDGSSSEGVDTAAPTPSTGTAPRTDSGESAPLRGAASGAGVVAEGNAEEAVSRSGGGSAAGSGEQSGTGWSFARITAMNGHFPTLAPSAGKPTANTTTTTTSVGGKAPGAWGPAAAPATASARSVAADGGGSGGGTGVWGARTNDLPRGTGTVEGRGISAQTAAGTGGGGGNTVPASGSVGKKKGRKGKAVPLFSNAGVRGGSR
ncbi:unnamed protein product [Scytosiphon promiscuus]